MIISGRIYLSRRNCGKLLRLLLIYEWRYREIYYECVVVCRLVECLRLRAEASRAQNPHASGSNRHRYGNIKLKWPFYITELRKLPCVCVRLVNVKDSVAGTMRDILIPPTSSPFFPLPPDLLLFFAALHFPRARWRNRGPCSGGRRRLASW